MNNLNPLVVFVFWTVFICCMYGLAYLVLYWPISKLFDFVNSYYDKKFKNK